MNMIRKVALATMALMLTSCGSGTATNTSDAEEDRITWPSDIVSDSGAISLPNGFLKWQTLGAWSTADEAGQVNGMHQVYISPGSADAYLKTGEFPDGTVLVKEVRAAETAALSTGAASFATDKGVWFVMIKDASKRYPDNPIWGDGWGWALFEAEDPSRQVATNYKEDCLACHLPAENTDWIYVEAYPVLWKDGKPPIPKWLSEIKASMDAGSQGSSAQTEIEPGAFAVCKSCHSTEVGKNGIGPSLAGIVGRKSGAVPGYSYSSSLKSANIVWTSEKLDAHIAKPASVVPGNKMQALFPGGVPEPANRRVIIEYLKTL